MKLNTGVHHPSTDKSVKTSKDQKAGEGTMGEPLVGGREADWGWLQGEGGEEQGGSHFHLAMCWDNSYPLSNN